MKIFLNAGHTRSVLGKILVLFALVATPVASKPFPTENVPSQEASDGAVLLGLVGFNYTDRHISEYSVDSASGGHINLSSPTSGGSGVTCCIKISKNHLDPILVKVRWQVDGCKFLEKNSRTGATVETRRFYYKEAVVKVQPVVGRKFNFVETHFYPDSQVRVYLTEHGSNPKLILAGNRPDNSHFSRCKNGEISR